MTYEPSPYWSSGGGGGITYAQDVANRIQIVYQNWPSLADQPSVIRQLAMSDIPTYDLARNAASLATSVSAHNMAQSLAQMSKDNQRLVWANLSDAQRIGLQSLGYSDPGAEQRSGSGFSAWAGPGALLGDVLDVGAKAVGGGMRVVNTALNLPVIKPAFNALTWAGDQPAHLYRANRMQSGGTQAFGLLGGILGAVGGALALPTGGASLALTGLFIGGGALLGASAAELVVARGDWISAFRSSWDGERVYTQSAQRRARELLADDKLLTVAKEAAFEGDLGALAFDLAGVRDSQNPSVLRRSLERYADRLAAQGTPEREAVFKSLVAVVDDPTFRSAMRVLQDGKISFGRDVARGLGLAPGDTGYGLLSGALDAAFVITLDPILAAGSAFQFARARKFGVATEGVADLGAAIRAKADDVSAVGRALDEVAAAVDAEDFGRLYRNVNAFKEAWIPTLAKARELKAAGKGAFTRDDLIGFISEGDGLKTMLSGAGLRSGYDKILLPRYGYSVMGKVIVPQRATSWAKAVIDISDSNNSAAAMRRRLGDEAEAFAKMAAPAQVRSRDGYALIDLASAEDAYRWTRAALDVVDKIPVANTAVRKMGALAGAMTSRLPVHGAVRLSGIGTADDVYRLVEMGRIVGMDDLQRAVWRNTIMNAPSEAARMDVVTSFIDGMLTTAGVRWTDAGSGMVDEFLLRVRQTYSNGEIGRRMTDGSVRRRGVLAADRAVELPIPDFKELRKAAQKGALLPMLNRVTDSRLVEGVMNVWKPAVLLRVAFIPRNAGEEIIGFIARNGPGAYMRQFGYRSVAEGQMYDEVAAMGDQLAKQWVDQGLMTAEEAAAELRRLGRLQYAAHVRPMERILSTNRWTEPWVDVLSGYTARQRTLLREGIVPGLVEKIPEKWQVALAGRPESVRRMVLAGADPERVAASKLFVKMNGGTVARELSAHEANLLGPTNRFEQSFDVPVTDRRTGRTTMQPATVHHGSHRAYGPDDRATPRMAAYQASRHADDVIHGEAIQHVIWHSPPASMRGTGEALLADVDAVAERAGNDIVGLMLHDLLDPAKALWSPTMATVATRGELGASAARALPRMDAAETMKWLRKHRKSLGYTPSELDLVESVLTRAGALGREERSFVAGRAQYVATFGPNARMAPRTLDDDLAARVVETGNAYYDFERAVAADGIHPDAPWWENPMVTDARRDVDAALIFGDPDDVARAEANLRDLEAATADEVAQIRRDWTEERREELMGEALAASNDHATLRVNRRPLEQMQARLAELDTAIANAATDKDRLLAVWQRERIQGQMDRWYPETIDDARLPAMPEIITDDLTRGPGWRPDGWLWDRTAQDRAIEAGVMDSLNRVGFQHSQSGMEWNLATADGTRVVNPLTEAGTRAYVPMVSTPAAEELIGRLASQGPRAVRDELRAHLRAMVARLSPEDAARLTALGEERISDFVDMLAVRGADGWGQIVADIAALDSHGSLPLAIMAFDDAATARLLSRSVEEYLVGSADLVDNVIGVGQIDGPRDLAKLAPVDLDGFSRPIMTPRGGATWDLEPVQMAHRVDAVSGGIVTLPNGKTAIGATLDAAQREHASMFVSHLNAVMRPGDTRLLTVATPGYFADEAATIPLEVGAALSPSSRVYDERGLPVAVQAAASATGQASLSEAAIAWEGWHPILRDALDMHAGTPRFITDHDVFAASDTATQHLLGAPSRRAFRAHWSDWREGPMPGQVIGPDLLPPDRKGLVAKIAEFGFGKVIAPALDATIRTPLAAHSFIEAMVENRRFVKWLKNPTVWGEMEAFSDRVTAAARLDDVTDARLADDLRKALPVIDPAAIPTKRPPLPAWADQAETDEVAADILEALTGRPIAGSGERLWRGVRDQSTYTINPDGSLTFAAQYQDHLGSTRRAVSFGTTPEKSARYAFESSLGAGASSAPNPNGLVFEVDPSAVEGVSSLDMTRADAGWSDPFEGERSFVGHREESLDLRGMEQVDIDRRRANLAELDLAIPNWRELSQPDLRARLSELADEDVNWAFALTQDMRAGTFSVMEPSAAAKGADPSVTFPAGSWRVLPSDDMTRLYRRTVGDSAGVPNFPRELDEMTSAYRRASNAPVAAIDGLDDVGLVRYAGDLLSDPARVAKLENHRNAAVRRVAAHPWWATPLRGAPDRAEAVVNLYRSLLGDALSRPFPAAQRAIDALPEALRAPLDADGWRLLTAADRNLASIDDVLAVTAQQRAVTNGLNWVDSHNMRSQFGEAMKAWSPFWYAEENFLRRWAKVLKMNPAAVRQGQLLYAGLKSGGMIQTDPQGRDWYVYPGSGLVAEAMGRLTPLPSVTGDLGVVFRAEPSSMLPGFNTEQTGIPTAGPLAGVGVSLVTQMFPELNDLRRTIVGEAAVNQAALVSFVPPTYRRLWETFTKDEDTSRKYASAMMSAIAIMDAKGMIPEDMTAAERDNLLRSTRDMARTILASQAVLGFIVPGSPQIEMTGESNTSLSHLFGAGVDSLPDELRADYLALVYELGPEEGLIRYLERHPDGNLWGLVRPEAFAVSQSATPSGAPVPATVEAGRWAERNAALFERYPEGAAWLFPPNRDGASNFDQYTYTQQVISDLRVQRTPEEFLNALKFKEGATVYFESRDRYQAKRRQLDAADNADGKRKLDAAWDSWSAEFKTLHPVFTEVLESGDSRDKRANAMSQLRIALTDPDLPDEPHVATIRTLVDSWDAFRYRLQQISLARDAVSQRRAAALKQAFSKWVGDYVYAHREVQSMWLTLMKPDVDLG